MEFDIGYAGATLAGLASFLTPCILPIVPFYLCYISGVTFDELTEHKAKTGRVVLSAVAFALGMLTIFVGLGAAATAFGQQVREYSDELRWVAAAIIFVLGLHYMGVIRVGLLNREARLDVGETSKGLLGAYLIGAAFAFGWTPCVGPILAAILWVAKDQATAWDGAGLLLAYGIGMVSPFILAAFFVGPFLRWAKGFRRHLGTVEKVIGGTLILFAVLIATNSMNVIAGWMLEVAPDLGLLQ